MSKKMIANASTMILIVILLSINSFASPQINQVNLTNPLNTGNTQTIYALITSENTTITLVNIEISNVNYSMNLNQGRYEYTYTPSQGTVNYKIYAKDNESTITTHFSSFIVKDLTPPVITIQQPQGTINTENTQLKISTNENSNCKYDTTNKTYTLMGNIFSSTGALNHESFLIHLPSGIKTYYISCQDAELNTNYIILNFTVNLGPSAQIILEKSPPLAADTYQVKVLTSKSLSSSPTLQYKFDDEQRYYQISLVGSDSEWKGYLVITPNSRDRIGTFSFSGTDYEGINGVKISEGEMFIVDTTKPLAPTSVDGIVKKGKIELSWFYDGESPDYFNIYRSENSGVEFVDYYDEEDETPFYDMGVEYGVKYYYRVAAVDKAGNIGELSSEVVLTYDYETPSKLTDITPEIEIPQKALAKELETELNSTYSKVKTLLFDINFAVSRIDKENDRFKAEVIKELKLLSKANDAKSNLNNILNELDELRKTDLSKTDFNDAISRINAKIESIKSDVLVEQETLDSLEFTESPSQNDIKSSIDDALTIKELDKEYAANFTKQAYEFQQGSTIFQRIIVAKLKFLDGKESYVTLVSKEVSLQQDAYNVILIERIPKEFSKSAKEITFSQYPKILQDDPVVYFDFPKLQSTKLVYYVNEKRIISDVKDAKTIVLPDPSKFGPKIGVYNPNILQESGENKVTGNFLLNSEKLGFGIKEYLFLSLGLIIIAGLFIYYFFVLKDDKESIIEKEFTKTNENNSSKIIENKDLGETPIFETNTYLYSQSFKHLLSLLQRAELHAKNLNFGQAIKEYRTIYEIYNSSELTEDEKLALSKRIHSLFNQIYNHNKKIGG